MEEYIQAAYCERCSTLLDDAPVGTRFCKHCEFADLVFAKLKDVVTPKPMTVSDAVATMNSAKHHGHSGWYAAVGRCPENDLVLGKDQYEFFESFEAIAIAEKYVREGKA